MYLVDREVQVSLHTRNVLSGWEVQVSLHTRNVLSGQGSAGFPAHT